MTNFQLKLQKTLLLTGTLIFTYSCLQVPASDQDQSCSKTDATNSHLTEISLKNMKDVVHRLRTASLDIISDVEQRNMVITGEPELIQPIAYDDTNQIGWARKMLELGPAEPPRPEWIDVDVTHLGKLVALLQSDFDASIAPTAKEQPEIQELASVLQDVQTHYKSLQDLTKGPKYNNLEIGKEALAIHDDMEKLNQPWKKLVQIVHKS